MDPNHDPIIKEVLSNALMVERFDDIVHLGGKGNFSFMFKAKEKLTNRDVAIKFYHPFRREEMYRLQSFYREVKLLESLKGSKNVIELLGGLSSISVDLILGGSGAKYSVPFEYYVMELAKSDIEEYIYRSSKYSAFRNLYYFREMCKGVARIHKKTICHRDLKPGNFLLFSSGNIKLGDFGTAAIHDGRPGLMAEYPHPVGDPDCWSPELFCNIGIDDPIVYKCDIFSLGAILYEMFTRTKLKDVIYQGRFLNDLFMLKTVILNAKKRDRIKIYVDSIDTVVTAHRLPDIYSLNNNVPNSIKCHLNELFQGLCQLNYAKRLCDFTSIYRKIDICMLILSNELRYKARRRYLNIIKGKQNDN